MLSAEINGEVYNDAIAINCSRSLKQLHGQFSIVSSANSQNKLPVKIGDSVKILADGNVVLNGYIQNLNVSYGANNHIIRISGYCRTSDMADSSVTGQKTFMGDISYERVARTVMDNGNMDFIDIIDEVGDIENFTSNDIIVAEIGQSIFDFLEKYARKRQFILTTNEDGNILFTRGSKERLGMDLLRLSNNRTNNIKSASLESSIDNRYNQYISRSQLNPYNQSSGVSASDISNQTGSTGVDELIRTSRILEFTTEHDEDNISSSQRAQFEANVRRANSVQYVANVQGHSINGSPFTVNRLAFINDDFADISSDMFLYGVGFNWSVEEGSTTDLSFTYPDAFSLNAQQQNKDRARTRIADGFNE